MGKINWTNEAVVWLKDIHDYISKDNPSQASKVVNGIYSKVQILSDFPEVGYAYKETTDIKILLYGHYRIAYLIKQKNDIDILGVFHGAVGKKERISPRINF